MIEKPTWRGILHQWAALCALVAGILLIAVAPGSRARVAVTIYALSLVTLFTVSATYHRIQWSSSARAWLRRADHASIFVLIGGTYTPVALLGLGGSAGASLALAIWIGVAVGVTASLFWPHAPKVIRAGIAVAVGWTMVPYIGDVRRSLTSAEIWLIAIGGVAYTLGAVVYAAKRPNPNPRVFGYHEVFHACTLVGAASHFACVLGIVTR